MLKDEVKITSRIPDLLIVELKAPHAAEMLSVFGQAILGYRVEDDVKIITENQAEQIKLEDAKVENSTIILDPKKDLVTQDPNGVYIFPFLDLLQKIRFHVPAKHQPDVLNSSWHFTDQEKKHTRVASEYQAIFNSYQILSALSQELKNASLTMKAYLIEMYNQAGEWELVNEKVAAFKEDRSHLYQVIEITKLLIGDLALQFTTAQKNFSYNYPHVSTDASSNNAVSTSDFDRDGYGLSLRKKLDQLQSLAEEVVIEVLPDVVAQIQPDAFVKIDELALELDEFSTAVFDVSSDEELP